MTTTFSFSHARTEALENSSLQSLNCPSQYCPPAQSPKKTRANLFSTRSPSHIQTFQPLPNPNAESLSDRSSRLSAYRIRAAKQQLVTAGRFQTDSREAKAYSGWIVGHEPSPPVRRIASAYGTQNHWVDQYSLRSTWIRS